MNALKFHYKPSNIEEVLGDPTFIQKILNTALMLDDPTCRNKKYIGTIFLSIKYQFCWNPKFIAFINFTDKIKFICSYS